MNELDTSLPSIRQVQTLIMEKTQVELKLTTTDVVKGRIIWQDQQCICLLSSDHKNVLVWRQAIVFLKPTT